MESLSGKSVGDFSVEAIVEDVKKYLIEAGTGESIRVFWINVQIGPDNDGEVFEPTCSGS